MSLDITQMPSKQRPANVLTLQAIELHTQKHLIPKHTSKQTGISTLTVQVFPLKYVTMHELLCFKNIWCQKNLRSHTLCKHNLKQMLPKVQAGAQTDTKCTLSHFIFTTLVGYQAVAIPVPFSDEDTADQKGVSDIPEGTSKCQRGVWTQAIKHGIHLPSAIPISEGC